MSRRRAQPGAARSGAWPLAWRLFFTKIHLKTDFGGLPIAFDLTGGEASDCRNFETLLTTSAPISIRALHSVTRAMILNQTVRPPANAEYAQLSAAPNPHERHSSILSESTLLNAGTHRTSGRQAQPSQGDRRLHARRPRRITARWLRLLWASS